MAIGHEVKQLDGMDVGTVVEQELPRLFGFFPGFARESVKRHDVVPNPHLRGFPQIIFNHALPCVLIHEFQHAFISRLHPVVQGLTAGLRGEFPHFRVLERLLKANQRRPLDVHLFFYQELRHFFEERGRIRFIGKEKMIGLIHLLEGFDFPDHVLGRLAAILVKIPLPVITERTLPPVTSPGRQVRKDARGDEIGIQGQPFEIGQWERRCLFRINFRIDPNVSVFPIHQVRNRLPRSITHQGFQ